MTAILPVKTALRGLFVPNYPTTALMFITPRARWNQVLSGFLSIKSKGSIYLTSAAPAKKPQKMAGAKCRLRQFSLVPGFGWCAQGFISFIALRPAFTAKTAGKSIYKFLFRNV